MNWLDGWDSIVCAITTVKILHALYGQKLRIMLISASKQIGEADKFMIVCIL